MTYTDICAHNQLLYELLEDCAVQLSEALDKRDQERYYALFWVKDKLLEMINYNLEMIEKIWERNLINGREFTWQPVLGVSKSDSNAARMKIIRALGNRKAKRKEAEMAT